MASNHQGVVGFVNLDDISLDLAASLLRSGYAVQAFEGTILDVAKSLTSLLPLLAVAHQQLILGSSHVSGDDDSATLAKVWEKVLGVGITDAANAEMYNPGQLANQIACKSSTVNRIGFIGLGAMRFSMATYLLRSNFCVLGYDVYKPTLTRFSEAGGFACNSPAEASKDVDVLIIMVTNEAQAKSVIYGDLGAVSAEGKNMKLVDAPVSGGVKRASMGTLKIMASGTDEALKSTGLVLAALSEKLYIIRGGCGAGSGVKMVNQLLAGVHIASGVEAMAFGARLGINTRMLFDVITNSGGTSWPPTLYGVPRETRTLLVGDAGNRIEQKNILSALVPEVQPPELPPNIPGPSFDGQTVENSQGGQHETNQGASSSVPVDASQRDLTEEIVGDHDHGQTASIDIRIEEPPRGGESSRGGNDVSREAPARDDKDGLNGLEIMSSTIAVGFVLQTLSLLDATKRSNRDKAFTLVAIATAEFAFVFSVVAIVMKRMTSRDKLANCILLVSIGLDVLSVLFQAARLVPLYFLPVIYFAGFMIIIIVVILLVYNKRRQ